MNNLWLDLLNSDYHDYKGGGKHEDRLENPQWLQKFLGNWDIVQAEVDYPKIIHQLSALRSVIRRMTDCYRTEKEISAQDIDTLNGILGSAPMISRIESVNKTYSFNQFRINKGQEAVLADIAVSFAEVLVLGEPDRIKICENQDCLWIFYDQSKNKSRKWCEGGTGCGNLMKVRRFRTKQKSQKESNKNR